MSKLGDLLEPDTLLHERFKVLQRIGEGGFGQVYLGVDIFRNGEQVAIKTEMRHSSKASHDPRRLIIEKDVLVRLRGKVPYPQ